ncbi:NAD-dependent epimerase/dehydratase family protein [Robertmurraya yapensis]|uniref:NAD-dependent epimerase/dehydratase family protein n=1 Tax=Bacillus yapensis TaxID=2492960 RepID=A0A3S0JT33_9BACI|nr:NAD(P)H-binding protein [Bacillus yapensis]RTR28378.1 NAD-dependent epimerase/dehydratase family protein [Bacillus yapensis]TKS94439.1 NAD-dependent epimerase/dehydratase family protein [Bacillus yapensis]
MKITIFGANGQIGQLVIKEALEAGYDVTAYTRRPNALNIEHEKLQIVVGALTDRERLKDAILGRDAVLSALGPALSMKRQVVDLPITEAHKAIISVMEECGLKRLITLGTPSISAKEDVKQFITVFPNIMPKLFSPTPYAEMKGIETLIKNSKMDWTVVRIINPNVRTNGNGYSVSFGDTKGKMGVSRYNAAKCMLETVKKDEWIHKMPIVFNN